MGQKITEDDIKYLLKNRKEILVHDRIRIKEIYTELSEEDSIEQMLSIPSYDFCTKVQSERTKQDLGNVLEHIQHMQRSKSLELRVELWGLSNEIEKINRLYICYQALSRINIQEFMIIKKCMYKIWDIIQWKRNLVYPTKLLKKNDRAELLRSSCGMKVIMTMHL